MFGLAEISVRSECVCLIPGWRSNCEGYGKTFWWLTNHNYSSSRVSSDRLSQEQLKTHLMMTSSIENISCVTGPLWKEFTVDRWIPSQRPVRLCFDVFFDLRLNPRLNKQSRRWWFETSSRSSWRHCNVEHLVPCRKNPSLVTTKLDNLRTICIFLGYIFMYFPVSVTILTWRWINSKHFTQSKRIVLPRVSFSFYPRSVSSFIFIWLRLGSRYARKYCLNICILFI